MFCPWTFWPGRFGFGRLVQDVLAIDVWTITFLLRKFGKWRFGHGRLGQDVLAMYPWARTFWQRTFWIAKSTKENILQNFSPRNFHGWHKSFKCYLTGKESKCKMSQNVKCLFLFLSFLIFFFSIAEKHRSTQVECIVEWSRQGWQRGVWESFSGEPYSSWTWHGQ